MCVCVCTISAHPFYYGCFGKSDVTIASTVSLSSIAKWNENPIEKCRNKCKEKGHDTIGKSC